VVATIPVGLIGTAAGINSAAKVTPNGAFVYVTNYLANQVSVIATATNTVVATVPMPNPICVAITPDGAFVYAVNDVVDTVSVIATATNTVVATVPVGSSASGVAITPNGAYAYVTNRDNNISVIATATNTVVATVELGAYPAEVAITPDGAYAYVTTAADGAVAVVATATNTVVATVPVESWPIGMAITPNGAYAYVANQFSNSVSVIATATNTVVASVPVGSWPAWVAFTGRYSLVQLVPTKLNFGTQPVGTRSLAKRIKLTNKSRVTVHISGIAITGADAGDFAETNTCGKKVASGASCFIKVTFKPLVKGKRTARVSVYDNAAGSPQQATLIGTGT
jgi:YVTN family beta-propeller protein